MKITELLDRATEPLISYEILPPKRGSSAAHLMAVVEELMAFDPPFIDVTSHSAEAQYEEMRDGTWIRRVKRKRPGTIGICAAIRGRYGIETVPHLLCHGFTRNETEDALIELSYLGINNLMALHGDDTGFQKTVPSGTAVNSSAVELVRQIAAMNDGTYLGELIQADPSDFCVGVAGYPEKHYKSPNLTRDIQALKAKLGAGAQYVTTQMFFDNRHYFSFVERCRDAGITVPIIPGVKILTSKRQLELIPSRFHVEIPEELAAEIEAAKPDRVADAGVEWALKQCDELMSANVPCLHFYIMQRTAVVRRVAGPLRSRA